jgi:Uma2 family endonuclease
VANARARSELPRDLDAFVRWHERQPETFEFVGGAPVMMAPASRAHTMLKGNVFAALRTALEGKGCTVYSDGIEIRASGVSAIPDVVVSCGPPDLSTPVEPEPVVIVEIVSPPTALRDRVEKWAAYRRIPSLRHYVLVEQERRLVELHTRKGDFVFEERFIEAGLVTLDAIGATLQLADIYAGVIDG